MASDLTPAQAPVAGSDVDSFCQKCGFTLAHIIIAMAGPKIARVECKTCHAVHGFRRPPGTASPASARPRTRAAAGGSRPAASRRRTAGGPPSLEVALAGRATDGAEPWHLGTRFEEGQVMRHARFAIGVVQRVLADDKVEVLFADVGGDNQAPGIVRVLAHARRQN